MAGSVFFRESPVLVSHLSPKTSWTAVLREMGCLSSSGKFVFFSGDRLLPGQQSTNKSNQPFLSPALGEVRDKEQTEKRLSFKSRLARWMTSGSVVIGGVLVIALALMYWLVPTRISLEAAVSRVEMTLGTFPTQQILNSLEIETISFGQFSKIELHPSSLHVADLNQYHMKTDSFSPTAWQPLTMFGYVRISPKTQGNIVTIRPENPRGKILGILDPIYSVELVGIGTTRRFEPWGPNG